MATLQMILKPKADAVERIEGELAKLNAEGAALCGQIEDFAERENEIEDAGQLVAAMAATKAARNRLRRIDLDIAKLRDSLDIARDEARAKLLAKLRGDYTAAARDFVAKAKVAQETVGRLIATREELQNAGFRSEYDAMPVPPVIGGAALLAPDLISSFEQALDPARRSLLAVSISGVQSETPAAMAVAAQPVAPTQPSKMPRELLRETAGEGEHLVTILRNGIEILHKGQLQTGDVVALPKGHAQRLVLSSAADFVAADELAPIDSHNAEAIP